MQVNALSRSIKVVDDRGRPTQELNLFTEAVSALSIIATPLIGNGAPEGIIEARQKQSYIDAAAAPGSRLYFKAVDDISGDKSLGWILL